MRTGWHGRRWMQRLWAAWAVLAAAVWLAGLGATGAAAQPRVVVSIKPLHSLAAAVMEGVGQPTLLIEGAASPHAYALRPSDARALQAAEVVFWAGPSLETFLPRALGSLARKASVVTLLDTPGLRLLPARRGGAWKAEADAHGHGHAEAAYNPHVWLDPRNAVVLARAMAGALGAADPAHAAAYTANAGRLARRLEALDAELAAKLAPYRERPFLVFHDAYAYLEARYGLRAAGALTVNPEQAPGARRVRELRATVRRSGAVCVFTEPQFEPRVIDTLVEGTAARVGVLDPLGAALPAGPGLYESLMRALAANVAACLGG